MGIPKLWHIPSIPVDFYHWLEPVTGSMHGEEAEVSPKPKREIMTLETA